MFKIQILNSISPIGLAQLPATDYTVAADIKDPDAILVRSQAIPFAQIPASVKVIGRAGVGVNNIPVSELTKRGIPVLNTPGANANAVSELVIAGMLLASRNICQAWDYVRRLPNNSAELEVEIEKNKKNFAGVELIGKTLGVVGLGSVGVKVANAAINLGMRVIGYDPTITVNKAWELSANVQQARDLSTLLAEADFVTLHVPLMPDTKNMIGIEQLKKMRQDVVLLNFARAEIVDHQALLTVLNAKAIHAYVSDFPCIELKDHVRVISLPHLGASTKEAEENCAVMVVKHVRDYLERGAIMYAVNFPNVDAPYEVQGTRLAIVNANVPNMVAQISSTLAASGLNIASLVNKSRDEIAYTLIDVNGEVTEGVLGQMKRIDGVIQCRRLGR